MYESKECRCYWLSTLSLFYCADVIEVLENEWEILEEGGLFVGYLDYVICCNCCPVYAG